MKICVYTWSPASDNKFVGLSGISLDPETKLESDTAPAGTI